MHNSEYNNPFLISKIISIVQDRHPEQQIGNYVKHKLAADGRGYRVRLTNGYMLVTYDALAQVYDADEIPGYTEVMIQTFEADQTKTGQEHRSGNRTSWLMQFFEKKKQSIR